MSKPKSKFPLWPLIIIILVWLIIVFWGIRYMVRYALVYDAHLDTTVVATIGTIAVAALLVATNIVLVAITKSYTDQTVRMADETKKMAEGTKAMVDFYYQKRNDDVMPLFIPHKEGYISSGNILKFILANAGKDALFVEIKTEEFDNEYKEFMYRVAHQEVFEFGHFRDLELQLKMASKKLKEKPLIIHLNIYFQDTLLNKYNQTIKFYWSELEKNRQFKVDLPIEQNKKSELT